VRNIAGSMNTAGRVRLWSTRSDCHHAVLAALGIDAPSALTYTERLVSQQARVFDANDLFLALVALPVIVLPVLWSARPPFTGLQPDV
jgi:MFS transporter, DHA2 family, multidrug resistance protein